MNRDWYHGLVFVALAAVLFAFGCEDEITGRGGDGQTSCQPACQADEVCQQGVCVAALECDPACTPDQTCEDGVCRQNDGVDDERGKEGSSCDNIRLCREADGLSCYKGFCRKTAAEGESCKQAPCVAGTYCNEDSQQCSAYLKLGERCVESKFCESKLCLNSVCSAYPQIGDSCTGELNLFCQGNSDCINDKCTAYDLSEGDECGQDNGHLCAKTLLCHENACVAPLDEGAKCEENGVPCKQGYICSSGKCVQNLGSCKSSEECAKDSYCCLDKAKCGKLNTCIPFGEDPNNNHDDECKYVTKPGIFEATIQCRWAQYGGTDNTPVIVDTPFGGHSSNEIVFVSIDPSHLFIINSETCEVFQEIDDKDIGMTDDVHSAAADVDGDGIPEIFTFGTKDGNRIVAYHWVADSKKTYGGEYARQWVSKCKTVERNWAAIAVHDIDGDGKVEVINRNAVIDAQTGECISTQKVSAGTFPVVGDLDRNGKGNLIASNGVLEWDNNDKKWVNKYEISIGGGYYAFADFGTPGAEAKDFKYGDFDGKAEIVATGSDRIALFTLSGQELYKHTINTGGTPTIGDFDKDGIPEISLASRAAFGVYDPQCDKKDTVQGSAKCQAKGILWERYSQDLSSGVTGSSLFDFDGDGQSEAIYADECHSRVYAGNTGEILFSMRRASHTGQEMPVVADVDKDGSAEIIAITDLWAQPCSTVDEDQVGVKCIDNEDCASNNCKDGYCRCTEPGTKSDCGKPCTSDNQCASKKCAGRSNPDKRRCQCDEVSPLCNVTRDKDGKLIKNYECTARIDDDGLGHVCRSFRPTSMKGELLVLRDSRDRWVSSRAIWNQHMYSITNINDDMKIPGLTAWVQNFFAKDEEQKDKLKYNNFRQNTQGLYGAGQAPNITAKFDKEKLCTGGGTEEIKLGGEICNRGAKPVGRDLPATFYIGDVPDTSKIICTAIAKSKFDIGECARVECVVPKGMNLSGKTITMVGNDNGSGQPYVEECNKEDNRDRTEVEVCGIN